MGDLISRSALIEYINSRDFSKRFIQSKESIQDILITFINEQPTAYDVEKVDSEVNDIAGRIFNYCEEIDNNIPEEERTGYDMYVDIQRLRECVRNGGKE